MSIIIRTMSSRLVKASAVAGAAMGIFALSAMAAGTWFSPSQTPPDGNVDAPINASYSNQIKKGNLLIRGLSDATTPYANGLLIENGSVGIGTLSPASKLHVNGITTTSGLKVTDGGPAAGKVLVALDNTGSVGWGTASGSGVAFYYGPVVEYTNKYIIEGNASSDNKCPSGYVMVGFNLYNAGDNFSNYGSLFCRKVLLVTPDVTAPAGGSVLPVTSTP